MADDSKLRAEPLWKQLDGFRSVFCCLPGGDGLCAVEVIAVVVTRRSVALGGSVLQYILKILLLNVQDVVNGTLIVASQQLHAQSVGTNAIGSETLKTKVIEVALVLQVRQSSLNGGLDHPHALLN